MTQAGGGLRHDLVKAFHEKAVAAGCRFFVMYGQTEATARISYVPSDRLGDKIGSIGVAIPGGSLSLASVEGSESEELVYQGPNVMMGYAESAADLAIGDTLHGVLRTGDLARRDGDGFHFLTGRLKRIAKLFGRRVNLEDVEHDIEQRYPILAAAIEHRDGLRVFAAAQGQLDLADVALYLAKSFGVPPKSILVDAIDAIPLTTSGKKNYQALPT
jgi:acyl-CoA synthetase (AMP-forming)/AMP-acid ligase II